MTPAETFILIVAGALAVGAAIHPHTVENDEPHYWEHERYGY